MVTVVISPNNLFQLLYRQHNERQSNLAGFYTRAVSGDLRNHDRSALCGCLWMQGYDEAECERIADQIIADRDTIALYRLAERAPEIDSPLHPPFTNGLYAQG